MQNIESKSDDRLDDNQSNIPENHRELLDQRIQSIDSGETTFRSWDIIKNEYEIN